jgi:hypothetical protein
MKGVFCTRPLLDEQKEIMQYANPKLKQIKSDADISV